MMQRIVTLIVALTTGTALAQAADVQSSGPSPVAYVYVSAPGAVKGFSVSAGGALTPLPGSPYVGIALNHMSVNGKYLFGIGQDQEHVYSYLREANGALSLTPVDELNTRTYNDCPKLTTTQVDRTGSTLYVSQAECPDHSAGHDYYNIEQFRINSNGTLQFLGNHPIGVPSNTSPSPLYFLANNDFGYQFACYFPRESSSTAWIAIYKRASDGVLQPAVNAQYYNNDTYNDLPCFTATDETNHLAVAQVGYVYDNGQMVYNLAKIASFTTDSNGTITQPNQFNVRTLSLPNGVVTAMSISPAGNLLAVGGPQGFQLFHFNGAAPVGYYTKDVLQPSKDFEEFVWDKSNHLFAVTSTGLLVYNVTPTAYSELESVSIPNASSAIAISLP
ncbi:MAG: hypothetical protein ABSF53_02500 [Terracidiphilus sp.]